MLFFLKARSVSASSSGLSSTSRMVFSSTASPRHQECRQPRAVQPPIEPQSNMEVLSDPVHFRDGAADFLPRLFGEGLVFQETLQNPFGPVSAGHVARHLPAQSVHHTIK